MAKEQARGSRNQDITLDPWGTVEVKDYDRLLKVFGIKPFSDVMPLLKKAGMEPSLHMKRGIIFGHRDFDKVLEAKAKGEPVAVLTGFMPSGKFHFGHKMTVDQLIYLQRHGFKIFVVIADAEASIVRKIPRKEAIRIGVEEYIASMIALGLDPKKTDFYFQTSRGTSYYRLIQLFAGKITTAEMEAIYGDISPAKVIAALTQAADILHVQLEEYGGYKWVVVPVGADQDPHLRLTRDIADRVSDIINLTRPASTYHRLQRGLDGGKMSSSRPEYTIFLTDEPRIARMKLMKALTGGRATAEEQRRLGGIPEACTVYDMDKYHLMQDDELSRIYNSCRSGSLLCGECKLLAWSKLEKFLDDYKRRLEKARDIAWSIVDVPKF
ncbi:MAG: tryptophan--tRNA ligase [Desulfurococcales archaeon]|nr:tryptophan--tRNA ligase [Desulfurococcales archaeon]